MPASAISQSVPARGQNLTIFLSTDGKHTVNVSGDLEDAETLKQVAEELYDSILEKYGAKAPYAKGGSNGGGAAQAPRINAEPFCADCGAEIKGFTDDMGKFVSGQVIASARQRKNGRVTCGKDRCKNGGGRDAKPPYDGF